MMKSSIRIKIFSHYYENFFFHIRQTYPARNKYPESFREAVKNYLADFFR